jgi:hypothetical protein
MRRILALALAGALLAACGGPSPYYSEESFGAKSVHRHSFEVPADRLCDAAYTALLAQGYVVARGAARDPLALVGSKEFKGEDNRHAVLQVHATCRAAAHGSFLYATAIESHFDVKQSTEKTSVGVPIITPLSITSTSESEAAVKTGGQTVEDRRFYERFYEAVARELGAR